MTLKELKAHFEAFQPDHIFEYTLSMPFSWRGSYNQVAFSVDKGSMTAEEALRSVNFAYSTGFEGYKGGEFYYNDETHVHFENEYGAYSDGGYTLRKIIEIAGHPTCETLQGLLVKLAFK